MAVIYTWPWYSTATTATTGITWPWYSTATTATTGITWPWYSGTTTTAITITGVWDQWQQWHEPVMFSAEEQQRQHEEASRRRLAETARLEGAQERALELLEMILTPEERVWRDQHNEILVRGSDGGMYVIQQTSVHGNVKQVDEHGCVLGRICAAPGMYDTGLALPLADGWIGQYLAIKHNEAEYRATGNWSSRRACQHPEVPVLAA